MRFFMKSIKELKGSKIIIISILIYLFSIGMLVIYWNFIISDVLKMCVGH